MWSKERFSIIRTTMWSTFSRLAVPASSTTTPPAVLSYPSVTPCRGQRPSSFKPDLRCHRQASADVDIDRAVNDLGRMGAEVDEHGSAERLAAGVVKAPVVLGALDDIAHDQAVTEQRLLM